MADLFEFYPAYTDAEIAAAYLGDPDFFDAFLTQEIDSVYYENTLELTVPLSPEAPPRLTCDEDLDDWTPPQFQPGLENDPCIITNIESDDSCAERPMAISMTTGLPMHMSKPQLLVDLTLESDQTQECDKTLPVIHTVVVPEITITYIPRKVARELTFDGAGPKVSTPGRRRHRGAKFPALVVIEDTTE